MKTTFEYQNAVIEIKGAKESCTKAFNAILRALKQDEEREKMKMKILIEFESNYYLHESNRAECLRVVNAILKNWNNQMQKDYKKHNYALKIARLCYGHRWKPVLEEELSGNILTVRVNYTTGVYARYVDYGQSE